MCQDCINRFAKPLELSMQIAEDIIVHNCKKSVMEQFASTLYADMIKELKTNKYPHAEFFEALFKALDPFEKRFAAMLIPIWRDEEKIIVANLKKMKKAWLTKDKIDDIMYPQKPFEVRIAKGAKQQYEHIMQIRGEEEMAKLERRLSRGVRLEYEDFKKTEKVGIDLVHEIRILNSRQKQDEPPEFQVVFDVNNPEVQKWLDNYVFVFSQELEKVNQEVLRRELIAGMEAGEGIPELTKRVNKTYEHWYKVRSEMIARTEVMRASNRASLEAYKQSGVVKRTVWITYFDRRTCDWCYDMDGKKVGIDENYHELGDRYSVPFRDENGNIVYVDGEPKMHAPMKLDYDTTSTPPLHSLCRCSLGAWFEE